MKNFYFGLATYHCLYSAYTDMVGKEKYLKMVNRNWIDTTPWMWFGFWIILLAVYFYTEYLERKNSKEIERLLKKLKRY